MFLQIRQLQVRNQTSSREVYLFQYLDWPASAHPDTTSLLHFRRQVHEHLSRFRVSYLRVNFGYNASIRTLRWFNTVWNNFNWWQQTFSLNRLTMDEFLFINFSIIYIFFNITSIPILIRFNKTNTISRLESGTGPALIHCQSSKRRSGTFLSIEFALTGRERTGHIDSKGHSLMTL